MLSEQHDRDPRIGDLRDEFPSREGENRARIGDLLGNLVLGVEGVSGGDQSPKGHNGEAYNGEEDGVRRENEDDVAFSDAEFGGERKREGVHGGPEGGVGERVAGGGVDEGGPGVVVVGLGGDEGGDV